MRHIVQIGIGKESNIHFEKGDIYIGCDPCLHIYKLADVWKPPPDFIEAYISRFAIVPPSMEGTIEFAIRKDNEENGFPIPIANYAQELFNTEEWKTFTCNAISLDTLINKHAAQGFKETIDFLYMSTSMEITPVLQDFSWDIYPKRILGWNGGRSRYFSKNTAEELLVEKGYNVFNTGMLYADKL